jgi:AAA family ATP:ADP antiporter
MLRNFKDSLVMTAPGSGADIIPFLKLWGTTPMAFLFTMIYMKLSNVLSKEKLFYAMVIPFAAFFIIFPTLLYPNISVIHPSASADALSAFLPEGFRGFVAIYRNWSFALFYVLAELWGSIVLSVLFWTLANEITKITEAKRFYGLFLLGANIALMVVSPVIKYIGKMRESLPAGSDEWGFTINMIMIFMVASTTLIVITYWYIRNRIISDSRLFDPGQVKEQKKKLKLGLWESIKFLVKSKYLCHYYSCSWLWNCH